MSESWGQVPAETLGKIAIGATAYAVGRRSYITATTASFLKAHWTALPSDDRARVVEIIEAARDRNALGDDCDAVGWRSILGVAANPDATLSASPRSSTDDGLAVMSAWRGVLEGGVRDPDEREAVADAVVGLFGLLSDGQKAILANDFDFAARLNPGFVGTEAWKKLRALAPEPAA